MAPFIEHFASLPDPRVVGRSDHKLLDIIAIAILGTICGAEGWDDFADFGECKHGWLKTFLDLPAGIPSADTFRRVLSALDPEAFSACFVAWMQALVGSPDGKLVAIDGKTARRSFDRAAERSPLHLVSAWVQQNSLTLGQVATDPESNEITAIPKLLGMLNLRGATVTIDAMGTQKEIAQGIVDRGAAYLLALKANQTKLYEQVAQIFSEAGTGFFSLVKHTVHETVEEGHGRRERRRVWTTTDLSRITEAPKWPGLRSITMVERERQAGPGGELTSERHYFISSSARTGAKAMASLIRAHWSIENRCHWVLDVAFREDESRVRAGQENIGLLRKIALNLLKQDQTTKRGIAAKRKKAGWNHDYLLRVLSGTIPPG
ncbi:ISAs1 family transposase [Sorangium sp. So ce1036]|uniref:ISAs1 family transposase n=1 Tax=Sorangium sp. So ce1036 TaxID=3133328 RepID=UPI003F034202